MTRWAIAGLAAAVISQTGQAQNLWPNQAKAPAPAAGPEQVVTMRTAGQPDRRVKVLRTETMPDGTQFTELKDLTTGAVYSIMGPPPAADPFPPSANLTTAAGEKLVPVNDAALPQAKPRPADPLLGAQAPLGPKSTAVAAAASKPVPVAQPPAPSKLAAVLFGGGTLPAQRPVAQQASANTTPKQSAFSKAVFGEWPQPQPAPVRVAQVPPAAPKAAPVVVAAKAPAAPPRKPEFSAPVVAVAPRSPEPAPPVLTAPPAALPRTVPTEVAAVKPAAPSKPVVAVAPPLELIKPAPVVAPPADVSKPVVVAAQPVEVVTPAPVAPPTEPTALVAAKATPAAAADSGIVQVSAEVEGETVGLLHQLQNHPKPSGRIGAAMALSELPTVSRPEVVQALVATAETDTVGVVRGNCILLLSAMGYAHPEYVQMLKGWEADDEPAVRTAVKVALAKVK